MASRTRAARTSSSRPATTVPNPFRPLPASALPHRHARGFTLLETLLALMVFSTAVVALVEAVEEGRVPAGGLPRDVLQPLAVLVFLQPHWV